MKCLHLQEDIAALEQKAAQRVVRLRHLLISLHALCVLQQQGSNHEAQGATAAAAAHTDQSSLCNTRQAPKGELPEMLQSADASGHTHVAKSTDTQTVPAALEQLRMLDSCAQESEATKGLHILQGALHDAQTCLQGFLDKYTNDALPGEMQNKNTSEAVAELFEALQQHVCMLKQPASCTMALKASRAQARLQQVRACL